MIWYRHRRDIFQLRQRWVTTLFDRIKSNVFDDSISQTPQDDLNKSKLEVVGQLNFIRDKILAKEDLQLHNHLIKLDIPLPIFGMWVNFFSFGFELHWISFHFLHSRWLRLLFGREFPLQDLLVLWDAIFAVGNQFELTNFIVVAMLIRIRHQCE